MKYRPIFFVTGIIAIVLDTILRYSVGRRRFNRRNPFGNQQYSGYNQALVTRAGGRVRQLAGAVLILVGQGVSACPYRVGCFHVFSPFHGCLPLTILVL